MSRRAISLKSRLWATAVLAFLGSIALLTVSLRSINEVKIRGPIYEDIVSYKDLLADILPPPEYLIEYYLTCFELLRSKGPEREALILKASRLESDFLERHAVWDKGLTHADIRKALLEEATPPALDFFRVMKDAYIPLLRQDKDGEARKVLDGPLTDAYRKHRAAIDKTVELANLEVKTVEAKADASLSSNVLFLCSAALFINALVILLTFASIRSIMRPMAKLMKYAKDVSNGDYDSTCEVTAQDEIGHLVEVLNHTVATIKHNIGLMKESQLLAQAEADNARAATNEANRAKALAERAKAEGMVTAATQIENVVEVISAASEELSAQIEQSSRGTKIQSSRVAETATAMQQMNATVLEVAKSASQAADSSNAARTRASDGSKVVAQVVSGISSVQVVSAAMQEDMEILGKQAEGIGRIMGVISDIADQTNLLALNAAIEAARAGDAGRGFAVVADEVRKLAEKTMTATKEVGEAINGIQNGTKKNLANVLQAVNSIELATALANTSGESLEKIVHFVGVSTDQVRSIAAASEQQSAASEQIHKSIEEINRISNETASAMDHSALAVGELARQAGTLRQLIDKMKRGE